MINRFALTLIFIGGLCFQGRSETAAAEADGAYHALLAELNKVRQEIAEAETEFLGSAAARFRQRHRAEYNVEDIIPLREEAKRREKELLAAREERSQYLQTRYPEYREIEVRIQTSYQMLREQQENDRLIAGDIARARDEETPDLDRIAGLEEDRAMVTAELRTYQSQAESAKTDLDVAKNLILDLDEEAVRLEEQVTLAEDAYREANAALQSRIDQEVIPEDLEQSRIDAANRLHDLRQQEQNLLEAISGIKGTP